jgi:signal transduction protein with GAF and PtsI domain
MSEQEKINIDTFKVVTRAIAESDDLEMMAGRLCQLLIAALEIKACTIFMLNTEKMELEILASFGLSSKYISKGPINADKSIGCTLRGEPVVVSDVSKGQGLQYPKEALEEGVGAIVSIPIMFLGDPIGVLRLYHYQSWNISERDLDSLLILGENIALAMRYTSLLNATKTFNDVIKELPFDVD